MFILDTEVTIKAKPQDVWKMITEETQEGCWNPLVKKLKGELALGNRMEVVIEPPQQKPMTFKPVITRFEENRELRWVGQLPIPGLFQGEHIFRIEDQGNGHCKLYHSEHFRGLLLPMLKKGLDTHTRAGFELMNQKMKEILEK
jgi:hypothetical protein